MGARQPTVLLIAAIQLSGLGGAVALGGEAARARKPVTVGVLEFVSKGGVSREAADNMADLLTEEIRRMGNLRVIGREELREMFSRDKRERLAEFEWKCPVARLGIKPVVRWVVAGNVTSFGKLFILNLKLFDLQREIVVGRVSRRIRGGAESLPEELKDAVKMLFEEVAEHLDLGAGAKTVTTAARHRQMIEESPSAVTVITRQDIEASGATTIPDLLRLAPGMDVITTAPSLQSLNSRLYYSIDNNTMLVLVDGRDVKTEVVGGALLAAQPISLEDIERIEVIRGPASALYGADAMAGVVNITTRSIPEKDSSWVGVVGGEVGMLSLGARTTARIGDWGLSVNGGADLSGMFSDPRISGKRVYKLRSVVEYRWPGSRRVLADAAVATGSGPVATGAGMISMDMLLKTARLAYKSEDLRGHVYWAQDTAEFDLDAPLEIGGVRYAEIPRMDADAHKLDGEIQWTLPRLWEPLMVIVGGRGRMTWARCDRCLDAETYADPTSSRYHRPGIDYQDARFGGFVHAELALGDWATVTGGLSLDYNTVTEEFISPRAAAVFRVAPGQYLRMGVARAFRKPAFMETHLHMMVDFPPGSPVTGPDRLHFQEFMTRVIGKENLDNERLLSFEAGYVGRFINDRLSVRLDLYYNTCSQMSLWESRLLIDEQGLPDLDKSSIGFENLGKAIDVFGGELSVRLNPHRSLLLLASWAYREVVGPVQRFNHSTPRNLITLGGRFRTEEGFIGSLYLFARSEFWERNIENPAGLLEPTLEQHMDNVLLVLGKLGWRWTIKESIEIEAGVKLFMPVSPFSAPHFQYREKGGFLLASGENYSGDILRRMLSGYLQGSF